MRGTLKFLSVSGEELVQALQEGGDLSLYFDDCSAVYMWRMNYKAPRSAAESQAEFLAWFERVRTVPHALVGEQQLTHFLLFKEIALVPGQWSAGKTNEFAQAAASPKHRKFFSAYMQQLAQFAPSLYVGETSNLVSRVRDHLTGLSGFGEWVNLSHQLTWADLDIHYLNLGASRDDLTEDGKRKRTRTLLETIATDIAIGGMVVRRG